MNFEDKLALITGGAGGIGRSVALAMAKLGSNIVIADLDGNRMKRVQQEIEAVGRKALAVTCDVAKVADIENLRDQTISTLGVPDILMNNAGIGVYGDFEKIGISDYESIMNINVLGVIRGVHAFLPSMLERGSGYIINTASRAGFFGANWPYPLSKYAVLGYSEGLYCHLRPKGIMVSALCPALVNTNLPFNSPLVPGEQGMEALKSELKEAFTGPESLDPDDVAGILINGMKEEKFLIITPYVEEMMEEAVKRGRDYYKLENYLRSSFNH